MKNKNASSHLLVQLLVKLSKTIFHFSASFIVFKNKAEHDIGKISVSATAMFTNALIYCVDYAYVCQLKVIFKGNEIDMGNGTIFILLGLDIFICFMDYKQASLNRSNE